MLGNTGRDLGREELLEVLEEVEDEGLRGH